ncbi:hypothetical protein BCV70DRAFT_162044, partial [Testicularia cyperi]
MSVLVDALEEADCQSVRIQAYGMKAPLLDFVDPAVRISHPLQEANVYDIGCTHHTGSITLVKGAAERSLYKQYPAALCVGRGYGGVEFRSRSRRDGIHHFKAYPVLTHVLKAVAQGAGQAVQPMRVNTCQRRIQTLRDWKQRLDKCPERDMCGVRLEVSVRAPSLAHAVAVAQQSKLLEADYLFSAKAGPLQLCSHRITKQQMLDGVDFLLEKA